MSNLLACCIAHATGETISLGFVVAQFGQRSSGALLLILGLPIALPIPMPGISILFGLPLMVISGQLLIGRHRPVLPACLARQSIPRSRFLTIANSMMPLLRRLERFVKPRQSFFAGDWTTIPIGAICFLLAVIITLPVPLGNVIPGLAISVLGLGLVERDGLVIALGVAAAILGTTVVTLASAGFIAALWQSA
ncbi:MAG TPA: exopolysaccharide biosynthesis protein [Stellaceae bacterium]|nr:exopolysaccharide biosynthesis protein [Stellaceae bacterium]